MSMSDEKLKCSHPGCQSLAAWQVLDGSLGLCDRHYDQLGGILTSSPLDPDELLSWWGRDRDSLEKIKMLTPIVKERSTKEMRKGWRK